MSHNLTLQHPAAPAQLFLLFHGMGGSPEDLVPLGEALCAQFAQAAVVSIGAPHRCDIAGDTVGGYQWFSAAGVTEESRPARIQQALPSFAQTIAQWQAATGVDATRTAVIGFSQGGIMALEASREQAIAARVIALSARMGLLPEQALADCTYHLIHGKADDVIHYRHCVALAETLVVLGNDVTADVLPFLTHTISAEVIELVLKRLTSYIPKKTWAEAMAAAAAEDRATRH